MKLNKNFISSIFDIFAVGFFLFLIEKLNFNYSDYLNNIFILFYFGIFPFINNCKTFGEYIFGNNRIDCKNLNKNIIFKNDFIRYLNLFSLILLHRILTFLMDILGISLLVYLFRKISNKIKTKKQ